MAKVHVLNVNPGATYSNHWALKGQYLCSVMHCSSPRCIPTFDLSTGLVSKILVIWDVLMCGLLPVTDISKNRNVLVFRFKR